MNQTELPFWECSCGHFNPAFLKICEKCDRVYNPEHYKNPKER